MRVDEVLDIDFDRRRAKLVEELKTEETILQESPASEKFESDIAKSIANAGRRFGIKGLKGVKGGSTKLSDVKITAPTGTAWLEAKMNHTDNLSNPRVFFDGKKWDTTYDSPVAKFAIDELNKSTETKNFLKELRKFLGKRTIKLPTTPGGGKQKDAVPLEDLRDFVTQRGNRYILNVPSVNLGKLVTQHYLRGKQEPAHYLQAKDDFYLIGRKDPLKINSANKGKVPVLGGSGDFRVRISTRSQFYEIQTEVKIKNYKPNSSDFSLLKGSKKINPLGALKKFAKESIETEDENLLTEQKKAKPEKNAIKPLDAAVLNDVKKVEDLLRDPETKEAAEKISIVGDLSLVGTQEDEIQGFPLQLKISGELDATDSCISGWNDLKSLEVGDSLSLNRAGKIDHLPPKLSVGGDLDIRGTLIRDIPRSAKVGGVVIMGRGQVSNPPRKLEIKEV